jgi:hypothetical protein
MAAAEKMNGEEGVQQEIRIHNLAGVSEGGSHILPLALFILACTPECFVSSAGRASST